MPVSRAQAIAPAGQAARKVRSDSEVLPWCTAAIYIIGGVRRSVPTTNGTRIRLPRSKRNARGERLRSANRALAPASRKRSPSPKVSNTRRMVVSSPLLSALLMCHFDVPNGSREWYTTTPTTATARNQSI